MSSHYSANQFRGPFKAKRLKNWFYGINHPGRHPNARCDTTCFIADERGHLLSHVTRNASTSPWGDYRQWIWEETPPCTCTDRIRKSTDYDRPPCSILVARERPRPRQEAREMAGTMAKTLFQPRARPEATAQIIHPPDGATQDMEPCSNKVTTTNESVGKTEAPGVNLKLNPQHFPQGANINVDARCAKPGVALNIEAEKCLPECAMFDVNTEKMGLSGINMDIQLKNDKDKLFEQEQF